jgi:hypothetical protein
MQCKCYVDRCYAELLRAKEPAYIQHSFFQRFLASAGRICGPRIRSVSPILAVEYTSLNPPNIP